MDDDLFRVFWDEDEGYWVESQWGEMFGPIFTFKHDAADYAAILTAEYYENERLLNEAVGNDG